MRPRTSCIALFGSTLIRIRQFFIRLLIGRMEVCTNMTVVNGYVEYGYNGAGAICENIRFISREPEPQKEN